MSKRRRRIFGALAAVAVILIGVLILFDWNWLKGAIESQVAGRLGRPFRIHGDLDVELSLQPKITVERAELGNAPWGSDAPMAKIDRAEVTVDLLKLLRGEIVLPEVRIAKPALLLETRPDRSRQPSHGPIHQAILVAIVPREQGERHYSPGADPYRPTVSASPCRQTTTAEAFEIAQGCRAALDPKTKSWCQGFEPPDWSNLKDRPPTAVSAR